MGTRADFYVGRGENAEWIGSIAWDGYPSGIKPTSTNKDRWGCSEHEPRPKGAHLFASADEATFRDRVEQFFANREDVTRPAEGWPWPWDDSGTTDYAYAFDGGKVYASCFGSAWWLASRKAPDDPDSVRGAKAVFPKMERGRFARPGDKRSGVIVIEG